MSISFGTTIRKFSRKAKFDTVETYMGTTDEIHRSIVFGSEITNAPGQPVATANLRDSWIPEHTGPMQWQDTTKVDYAQHVEDNVRGVTFKNHGPHSVKLTKAGYKNIVEHVLRQVKRRNG